MQKTWGKEIIKGIRTEEQSLQTEKAYWIPLQPWVQSENPQHSDAPCEIPASIHSYPASS